eukprot:6057007-Prymnesium_polylepis.1
MQQSGRAGHAESIRAGALCVPCGTSLVGASPCLLPAPPEPRARKCVRHGNSNVPMRVHRRHSVSRRSAAASQIEPPCASNTAEAPAQPLRDQRQAEVGPRRPKPRATSASLDPLKAHGSQKLRLATGGATGAGAIGSAVDGGIGGIGCPTSEERGPKAPPAPNAPGAPFRR